MEEDIKDTLEEEFDNMNFNVNLIRKNCYLITSNQTPLKIFFNYIREYTYQYNLNSLIKLINKLIITKEENT